MRHDAPGSRRSGGRDGLTVVEIVLLIALIVLPLTLVLILFGKDIKRYIGRNWGTARNESEKLYRHTSGTGIGTIKGQVGAAGTGEPGPADGTGAAPAAGEGATGDGGTAASTGSGRGSGAGTGAAPRTSGGGQGRHSDVANIEGDERPASLAVAGIAVCVALVVAVALSRAGLRK